MATYPHLYPYALRAAQHGLTANAFYETLRSLGVPARKQEVLRVYKEAKAVAVASQDEPFRPQNEVPSGDALTPWPVKEPGGISQTVTLIYRDRATGERKRTYYRVKTDNGVTREQAISIAVAAYSQHAEDYEQDLETAIHTSAQLLVPKFGG